MRFKFLQFIEDIQTSYLFYPLIFSIFSIVVLILALMLDISLKDFYLFREYKILQIVSYEIRGILSTIVTTSATVTSVTFSITVLILSQASNQLGPRLLPNFIRQGRTQIVLSVFVSSYLYALLLTLLSSNKYFADKPIFIALYVGVFLAIISIFFLIYFIHYVSRSIQVDYVLQGLYQDTLACLNRQFIPKEDSSKKDMPIQNPAGKECFVPSNTYGYIQTIDLEALYQLAIEQDIVIEVLKRPGEYIFNGLNIVKVSSSEPPDTSTIHAILSAILMKSKRTLVQDIEYGFEEIVEIAMRALSPGMNNPFTAINCIHILGQLLYTISQMHIPEGYRLDGKNIVRLIYIPYTYKRFVDLSFDKIRQNAQTHIGVTIELLSVANTLLKQSLPTSMRSSLIRQIKIIVEQAQQETFNENDYKCITNTAFAYQDAPSQH